MSNKKIKEKHRKLGKFICCINLAKFMKSKEYCKKAIDLDVFAYNPLVRLGNLCYRLNYIEGAIECYEKIKEINPEEALPALGWMYESAGKPKKGSECFIELAEIIKDKEKAEKAIERAVQICQDPEVIYKVGMFYEDISNFEKAEFFYKKAVEKGFDLGLFGLGNIYFEIEELEKAEKAYEMFLKRYGKDYEGLFNLALVKAELGKLKEALKIVNMLLEENSNEKELYKEIISLKSELEKIISSQN